MCKLTPVQQEVFSILCERHPDDSPIYPELEFPARNARDNGKRRAVYALYKRGILIKHPAFVRLNVYQITDAGRAALDAGPGEGESDG